MRIGQSSQEQLNEAFNKAHELEPTSECWGLFAYSDAPPMICGSGIGSFQWFPTESDLIAFVRDYFAWWHPAPSSMEPEEIAAEVQAIVDAESDDVGKMVSSLNESMRNMWQIEWVGQFRDLCEGENEFPVKIRGFYYQGTEFEGATPIPQDDVQDFREYLQTYGC